MEKNRVPLCCSAMTEPEMSRTGNWARPGPRMLGCTRGRLTQWRVSCFMFVPIGDLAITVQLFNFIPPSLRTFVSSPVNCLFEMTVPINLTKLRVLMTFVKTVSVTPEILTFPSNWSSLRFFSFLRWSNRDVALNLQIHLDNNVFHDLRYIQF